MDCNSYSYTPYMLDGESEYINQYENDDMQCEVYYYAHHFWIYAMSYDGTLETAECYKQKDNAVFLYNFIVENYAHCQPEYNVLNELIRRLHRIEKGNDKT